MRTGRASALLLGVIVASVTLAVACSGDGDASSSSTTASSATPASTTPASNAPASTGPASSTTSEVAMDPRSRLTARLAEELDDRAGAVRVVAAMDDAAVDAAVRLADGDVEGSDWLSYRPSTVDVEAVDSLWVFAYGYRFAPGVTPPADGAVPTPDQVVPGPVNEALATAAAELVDEHPVPIVTQPEVAQALAAIGVSDDVITVGPNTRPDGTVEYLSTAGVVAKGRQLLADRGDEPGRAGVLCFSLHAVRCLLTARAAGLTADVPAGVELPSEFDPESGQGWTRSLVAWIPTDLVARAALKG